MEKAIASDELLAFAHSLKSEGVSQREMYDLFAKYAHHYHDIDEAKYDAIVDTIDCIVGYCRPDQRLFETGLQT